MQWFRCLKTFHLFLLETSVQIELNTTSSNAQPATSALSKPMPLTPEQQNHVGGAGIRKLPNGFW
jgi:hypothetical protein